MTAFNYIFIFLLLSFGSIESKVVLNEVMADPTPVVGMPDREYLELYNISPAPVNLKNWTIELSGKQKVLPDVTIDPLGYLLVTSTGGAKDMQQFGKVIELSGFGITNSGMAISLYNSDKQLIDKIDYAPSFHRKGCEDGGYSLERIDPERQCGQSTNWITTLSAQGGTPGAVNSVQATNLDQSPPQILHSGFFNNSRLEVQFSENVVIPMQMSDFLQDIPVGVVTDSVAFDLKSFLMKIWFRSESILNGMDYTLLLHGLKDECGNIMADQKIGFGFYTPVKSDLQISEVLFNPFPDGTDFVEIYNNSGHQVDLSGLYLATRDEVKVLKQVSPISSVQQYLPNGSYLALTKSPEAVLQFYRSKCDSCFLKMEKFPTLTDLAGTVVLLNGSLQPLDEMAYSDAMHDPLMAETEGISLERISFGVESNRMNNWHSASKNAGFATPGYKNSVTDLIDSTGIEKLVAIDPEIFSPNGDGINDELKIHLNPGNSGWILNITILNCAGRVVRYLANNLSVGSGDTVVWDGSGVDFQKVQPGIYLLNVSLFHPSGIHHKIRTACVVTDRL